MRGGNFQHICLYLTRQLSYWKLMDKVILSVYSSPIVLKIQLGLKLDLSFPHVLFFSPGIKVILCLALYLCL